MNEKQEEKKKFFEGVYVNFKILFDKKDDPHRIYLEIEYSNKLKEIIKDIIVDETKEVIIDDVKYNRYLVKKFIMSRLAGYKNILFIDELIDSGKVVVGFETIQTLDYVVGDIKSNIKTIIEIIYKYKDLNFSVNYNVGGD